MATIRTLAAEYDAQPYEIAASLDLGADYSETTEFDATTEAEYRKVLDIMRIEAAEVIAETVDIVHLDGQHAAAAETLGYDPSEVGYQVQRDGEWQSTHAKLEAAVEAAEAIVGYEIEAHEGVSYTGARRWYVTVVA